MNYIRKLQVYFSLAFILLISGCNALRSGKVQGMVTGEDGIPVSNAEVKLVMVESDKELTTQTDEEGNYLFESVAPGEYLLAVSIEGECFLISSEFEIEANETETQDVNDFPCGSK